MRVEFDLARLVAFLVDFRQGTAAVAQIDSLVNRIVAKIVGIIAIIQSLERGIGTSIKYPNASILGIGDVQPVRCRNVKDALRFLESVYGLYSFTRLRIDHFYRVVAKRRNEQSLPFYIDGHVVDAALHL